MFFLSKQISNRERFFGEKIIKNQKKRFEILFLKNLSNFYPPPSIQPIFFFFFYKFD
jgi:hypothetical protein